MTDSVNKSDCPDICELIRQLCPHVMKIDKVPGATFDTLIFEDSNCDEVHRCEIPHRLTPEEVCEYVMSTCPPPEVNFEEAACRLDITTGAPGSRITNSHFVGEAVRNKLRVVHTLDANCVLSSQIQGSPQPAGSVDLRPILDKVPTNLTWDPVLCRLTFIGPDNITQVFDLNAIVDKVPHSRTVWNPTTCQLTFISHDNVMEVYDIGAAVLEKMQNTQVSFNAASCIMTVAVPNQPAEFFDLGDALANKLTTTVAWDSVTCRLSVNGPGGANTFDIGNSILAKIPDPVVYGLVFDANTCIASLTADNVAVQSIDITPILNKIEFPRPVLACTVMPDGSQRVTFNDGQNGAPKVFDIPAVVVDADTLTVNGPSVTFNGDNGQVVFNVCDMIAQNCNATFTQINTDGSWQFRDNAGAFFNYQPPNQCCDTVISTDNTVEITATPDPNPNNDGFIYDLTVEHPPFPDIPVYSAISSDATVDVATSTDANGDVQFDLTVDFPPAPFVPTYDLTSLDGSAVVNTTQDANGNVQFDLQIPPPPEQCCDVVVSSNGTIDVVATPTGVGDGTHYDLSVNVPDYNATSIDNTVQIDTTTDAAGNVTFDLSVTPPDIPDMVSFTTTSSDNSVGVVTSVDADGNFTFDLSVPAQCCDEVVSTDGTVNITQSATGTGPGQRYDISVTAADPCCDVAVSSDGTVNITSTPTGVGGGTEFDLSVPLYTVLSDIPWLTATQSFDANGNVVYTLDGTAPDTDTVNTVVSTDGTVTVTPTTDANGDTEFDLSVSIPNQCCDTVVSTDGTVTVTTTPDPDPNNDGNTYDLTVTHPVWQYVPWDETLHAHGNAPAGSGTAADPFQIPVCCDPDPVACTVTAANENCTPVAETVTASAAVAAVPDTPYSLTYRDLNGSQVGWGPFDSRVPALQGTWNIPVPTHAANCVVIAQAIGGGDGPATGGLANNLGRIEMSGFTKMAETVAVSHTHSLFIADAGLVATDVTVPDQTLEESSPGRPRGVLSVRFLEVCRDDGQPLTETDFSLIATNPQGAYVNDTAKTTGLVTADDCPGFSFMGGRHVQHLYNGDTTGIEAMQPNDWVQYSAGDEIWDFTSWDLGPEFFPDGANICQVGGAVAFIDGNQDYAITSELNNRQDNWEPNQALEYYIALDEHVIPGTPGSAAVMPTLQKCDVSFTHDDICDTDVYDIAQSWNWQVNVVLSDPAVTVNAIPVVNGLDQTAIALSAGVNNLTGSLADTTLATTQTVDLSVCFRFEVTSATGSADITVNGGTTTIAGT